MEEKPKEIEEWRKIEDEVFLGRIKAPYPKKICSDCKNVIETFGNLKKLYNITSCPRCDSGNLKLIKGAFDEWYEKHLWFRVISWVVLFPLYIILFIWAHLWVIIPIIGIFFLVILFGGWIIELIGVWIIEHILYVIGAMGVVVLAAVLLWKWEKLKKEYEVVEKAVAWELEDQLKELKEQLGRGVITQEEYEQKKKELLEESSVSENKWNA